ncbi:serine/threonine protein kinase [Gigaspora margarita]|uniref:Serine/threonine protein kinase n=1 Tax=Gigaspora margarita TaxID=4874 RepID=A0A8H4AML6_GIGMA|nr:serine/threonine protein kinase [Gigaspora margarita]
MDQTALHFLRYPFSHGYEYLPKTIIIILFETLLWRIIDIDCCIYTFIFSLIIAIYLETDKDHLRSFHLILNRYFNLSLISGCFLLLASISYFLYGYWISSILVFSVLIYSSMSSLPKMFFPYDILVFLIRICSLSLYLYLFPALLKEIAYILSLFMPSFLLQISHLSGYYLFLATTIFVLDVQDKMINSVTLSRALQVYRLRKKERGILEYINNYIDKVKASDIPITPFCQCQNSGLKVNNSGWCESCGLGLVPGVMLPPWTSGNPEINRIIFHTQIKSNHIFDHIEWINYDRFTNVKKIIKGARGDGYSASWIDGPMCLYGMARNGEQNVIIKSLGKSSSNVTPEFLRELESYVKLVTSYTELRYELLGSVQCYGLTRDPNTQEYIDIEKKSTIFESDDVVHYSQFIDLDAISKEETFEVLDDDDLYSAKPYNIGTPSDVSTN